MPAAMAYFCPFWFRHLQLDQLWRGKTCQQSTCASPTGVWPHPVDWHGLGLKRRRHQDSLQWVGKTNICLKSCNWLIDWLIEFLLSKSKTRFEHVYIDTLFWLLIFIVGSAPLFLFLFLARPSHVHSTRPPSPRKARKLKSTSQEDRCMWCDYMEGWFPDPI